MIEVLIYWCIIRYIFVSFGLGQKKNITLVHWGSAFFSGFGLLIYVIADLVKGWILSLILGVL